LQALKIIAKGVWVGLKTVLRILIGLNITVALLGTLAWIDMHRFANNPGSTDPTQVIIEVAPGETFGTLCARLKHHGIVTSAMRFKLLARVKGDDKRIKAGEYGLSAALTPLQVLDMVVHGRVLLHRLTIPEGHTIDQIAEEIGRSRLSDPDAFRILARDTAVVETLGLEGPSLEGYLFPDTYYFPNQTPALAIIQKMVQTFREQFSDEWHQRAQALNLSILELVTLASIIEKETGHPSERALIASVFHNRMKKNMRLESDPTAVYGIEPFEGKITRRHVQAITPYNTYRIRGLPPGPIANPGRAAIEAALYPAQTEYLFFVSKNDGSHHFSPTYAEHNEAVRIYLRGGRPQP
jgi:UPF0755 protein